MSQLYSTSSTSQGQSPAMWDCLCFLNNDMQLASNSRYGKVYTVKAGVGSTNPWYNIGAGKASAEVSKRRANDLGKWDWFAGAYKIDSGLSAPDWIVLMQFGYPTLSSPPLALGVHLVNGVPTFVVDRNAGLLANNGYGFYAGTVLEQKPLLPIPYGKWVDFVIGVKWATDKTGEIRAYARVEGQTDYTLRLSESATPTWQYGTTPYGTVHADGTDSAGNQVTVIDHGGLYYGYWDARTTFQTEYVVESGITRASDYATAAATLP
jgi:hypothetical protein